MNLYQCVVTLCVRVNKLCVCVNKIVFSGDVRCLPKCSGGDDVAFYGAPLAALATRVVQSTLQSLLYVC